MAETVRAVSMLAGVDLVAVVDDASSDMTSAAAEGGGALVLRMDRRTGKGGAIEQALDRLPRPLVYLLVDADLGETATGLEPLLRPVLAGDADLAVGRLPPQGTGGFGIVKRASAAAIRWCSGFEATEPLSGQRAVSAECLHACRPLARGFGLETAMTIDAVRLGYRVVEMDVDVRHRPTGRDLAGFLHRGRQGWDAAVAVLPRRLRLR